MRAKLHAVLHDRQGDTVDERRATNTVMAGGAQLLADLFAGNGTPISHMAVGTSDSAPDDVERTELANAATGDDPPLDGETAAPIPAEAFSAEVIAERRVVQVRVRGTLPADAAIGRIREAGLVAENGTGSTLYNRVVFAPIDKAGDHELTLFWEVEFPFGELQWLN